MAKLLKTICSLCPINDCGMDVFVTGGRIERIAGMREHPVSKGYLCPKGLAAAQIVSDTRRLRAPLRRKGKRGQGNWEAISWDAALDIIAKNFEKIKNNDGAQAIGFMRSSGAGWAHNWDLLQRFAYAYGSPNLATNVHVCFGPRAISYACTLGGVPEVDFENTNCMLFWGFNPAETYLPNYGRRFIDAKARGAKLIVIDPRFSRTASKADIHVAIRPGTDGALALGIANVLINEALYDREFVQNWTSGFEQFAEMVKDYPPEKVEGITGVPKRTIWEVGTLFGGSKPALLRDGNGIDQHTNAVQTARAIQMLSILTGNVAVKGGQVLIPPLALPDIALKKRFFESLESNSVSKHPMYHRIWSITQPDLFEAISKDEPYTIRALFIQGSSPVVTNSRSDKIEETLSRVEFIVANDLFMNSAARLADIVLPGASFLECTRLRYTRYLPTADCRHISLQNKIVDPVGQSKADEDIILELARRVGLEEFFPWKNIEDVIEETVRPLGVTIGDLRDSPGGIVKRYPAEELYRTCDEYRERGFATPCGKVEIYSSVFEKFGYDPLPRYVEPMESPISRPDLAAEYPLICCAGIKSVLYTHTQMRTLSLLNEIIHEPWVTVNPQLASELEIRDGEMILAESPRGSIKLKVKVSEEAVNTDTVLMPYGWGQPYADSYPVVNSITPDSPQCPISSSTANHAFLCRIKK